MPTNPATWTLTCYYQHPSPPSQGHLMTTRPARTLPLSDRPGGRCLPAPATRPRTPRTPSDTAHELATHLGRQGHTQLSQHVCAGQAVIWLPQLTVWVTASELTWTYNGQPTTWPAHDTHSAARYITRIIHDPDSQRTPRHARRARHA